MDAKLLQTWLRLPDGEWPPPPRVLLGLDPGPADPTAVESRVLERMAVLRRHQNRHPDLVTEGMNRLAQALVALTDSGERADEPPPSVPTATVTQSPLNQPPDSDPVIDFDTVAGPDEPEMETHVLALPDEDFEPPPAPHPISQSVGWLPADPPPGAADPVEFRRQVYRRRCATRACRRLWERLGPFVGHPDEPLDRPEVLAAFLHVVADARGLPLPFHEALVDAGRLVAATLTQPAPAETLRLMLPDQRQAVAVDWQRGRDVLAAECVRLLALAAANRPPRRWSPARLYRILTATPEFGLGFAALVAAALLLARAAAGR